MFSKHRVEALSDGVFAIVMTLLVLDLKVPDEAAKGHLGSALLHGSHEWVSFVITFAIASVFWVFQHKLFDLLSDIHQRALVPTFLFLGLVSVLPFSTSLFGHHIAERLAFIVYFANQFLISLALLLKFEVLRASGAVAVGPEASALRLRLTLLCAVLGSTMLGAAFLPLTSVWIVPVSAALLARIIRARLNARHAHANLRSA